MSKNTIYDLAVRTPLEKASKISTVLSSNVYFKREDLQPVYSFKIRGAYNKMLSLTAQEKLSGVIAASAGNHAQGVALSAQKLGISALIVMPKTTPRIKVDAVAGYGAEIVLSGDNYSEAAEHCEILRKKTGRVFIHPFDDPLVIDGQGTIGSEILQQLPLVTHVFVPVGGGGLIAGVARAIKSTHPHVKIIGVEPEDAGTLYESLKHDKRVILPHVGIFADGVAVKQIGKNTFDIARKYVDEVILVTNDQLCAAIKRIFEETRSIVEPAGALGVAGIEKYAQTHALTKDNHIVAINSGANMSFERLQYITERTLIGSGHEALFSVELPEKPGALEHFCKDLGKHNISEFNYRQNSASRAHILVGITTYDTKEAHALSAKLTKKGYTTIDLTDNDLAKEHVRHMVGGTEGPKNEILVHFDFPERPGALGDFLQKLGRRWNICLFHYRGMGADSGRVLIGFDVNKSEAKQFKQFLIETDFEYTLESTNPAYSVFLRN